MMINTNTLIWIVVAWLLTAFFAGLEVAFVTANRLHIELKKKQGLRNGIILSGFMEHPARFIGTTLVGFNLFLVIFGLMIGETFLPLWNIAITRIHIPSGYVNVFRLFSETLVASAFILVFGEFIPKALFRAKSDAMMNAFARITEFITRFFYPIASFFVAISGWVLKYVFNVRMDERKGPFTRADLENFYQQTSAPRKKRPRI